MLPDNSFPLGMWLSEHRSGKSFSLVLISECAQEGESEQSEEWPLHSTSLISYHISIYLLGISLKTALNGNFGKCKYLMQVLSLFKFSKSNAPWRLPRECLYWFWNVKNLGEWPLRILQYVNHVYMFGTMVFLIHILYFGLGFKNSLERTKCLHFRLLKSDSNICIYIDAYCCRKCWYGFEEGTVSVFFNHMKGSVSAWQYPAHQLFGSC